MPTLATAYVPIRYVPLLPADLVVNIMLETPAERIVYGGVGTVEYRDDIDGERFTVHHRAPRAGELDAGAITGPWWITRHVPAYHANGERAHDTDGPAVARSHLVWSADRLNALWEQVRHSTR